MSKAILLVIAISMIFAGGIVAQEGDWRSSGNTTVLYNCDSFAVVSNALQNSEGWDARELQDELFAQLDDGEVMTLGTYISLYVLHSSQGNATNPITMEAILSEPRLACSETAVTETTRVEPATVLFNVVANGNGNLRSCAGTNCSIVGHVTAGELLAVVAQEADWYQIQTESGTAYIAAFLTIRGPDDVIDVNEPYFDSRTGCAIVFDIRRGDMDMNFILSGDRRNDVVVDLYRPNESSPLTVAGQLDKTFIDTGEPYIHQYYRWNVGYPAGLYNLEISIDGDTSRLAWERETTGDYFI